MHVNAKPFKAGFSKAFLPKTHLAKIATKKEIAKAYLSGVPARELASDYGITIMSVIQIGKWYDRELETAKRMALAFAPIVAQPKREQPTIDPVERTHGYGIGLTYLSRSNTSVPPITLPLVSIQRKRS